VQYQLVFIGALLPHTLVQQIGGMLTALCFEHLTTDNLATKGILKLLQLAKSPAHCRW
jgi:hypothetical protein